jgi:hypothetical protein
MPIPHYKLLRLGIEEDVWDPERPFHHRQGVTLQGPSNQVGRGVHIQPWHTRPRVWGGQCLVAVTFAVKEVPVIRTFVAHAVSGEQKGVVYVIILASAPVGFQPTICQQWVLAQSTACRVQWGTTEVKGMMSGEEQALTFHCVQRYTRRVHPDSSHPHHAVVRCS